MLLLCPFVALVVPGNLLKCNFIINDRTLRGKGKKKKKRMFNRRAKNGELPLFPLVPVSWLAVLLLVTCCTQMTVSGIQVMQYCHNCEFE